MKRLLIALCLSLSSLSSAVYETAHFSELPQYVTPDTLVILDIDVTLLIPDQTLGCDVWFREQLARHQREQMSDDEAWDLALAQWEAVRHLTQVKIVEEGCQEIVSGLQSRGVRVMGLTTQGLALANRTVRQLQSLGIDLSASAPSQQDQYFINGQGVLYRDGVLFTAGTSKGESLLKLLELLDYEPACIVFLNDKMSHIRDLVGPVELVGIPVIGLRYSYSDARVAGYRSEIADIQFRQSSFDHILSDEEAQELLNLEHGP